MTPAAPTPLHRAWRPAIARRLLLIAAAGATALSACHADLVVACPSDLRMRANPSDTTLVVGQSFVAKAHAYGCAGTKRLDWAIWFASADPVVLHVDSATARVTAAAPGSTWVEVHSERAGMIGWIPVTVTPAP